MTTPAPPITTRRKGLRNALVDAAIVGTAVYHPSGLDQARVPYIVLTDAEDVTAQINGDGGPTGEAVTGEARLYQANARDADPGLAPRITAALHGLRFTVVASGVSRRVFVRAESPTVTEGEGLHETTVRFTCYQRPGTP